MAELNINFMSNEKFNSLEEIDEKSLFIINDTRIHNDLDETINGVKTFNDEIYAPNQVDYSKITNCITEIPQDIKLELVDGTLTLKAGSKLTWGGTEYRTTTTTLDREYSYSGTNEGKALIFSDRSSGTIQGTNFLPRISSGKLEDRPATATGGSVYYSSDDMQFNYYGSSGWAQWHVAYPLALVTITGGKIASIDQVFNGFGYIGSTVFALPGVKGLIPDGRNEDGSLKNIEVVLTKVSTTTFKPSAPYSVKSIMTPSVIASNGNYRYDKEYNYIYNGSSKQSSLVFAETTFTPTGITSFQPKTPFRAADYNEVETKQDIATAINYNNVTNCITHIPQDIKLELVDGTLTLKAGSKVYVPNGVGVFDEVTITQDILYPSLEHTTTTERVVFLTTGKTLAGFTRTNISSETTQPNSSNIQIWYDTTNNLVKSTNDSGATWISGLSLPICIGNYVNQVGFTSIDQVFNGFGYVGTELFCLPGVKALIPDGRNEDGSLKNRLVRTTEVSTLTANGIGIRYTTLTNNGKLYGNYNNLYYSDERNIYTGGDGSGKYGYMQAIQYVITNGVITEFNPKLSFRAVDYNDLSDLISQSSSIPTITYWED